MYRANVDAVDGLKVLAGGKWLTCIGNRNVKVGDRIWTDGRCVYGHDREGSAPIVIAPPKEDLAIPISIIRQDRRRYYAYTSKLKDLTDAFAKSLLSKTEDDNKPDFYKIGNSQFRMTIGKKNVWYRYYSKSNISTAALNVTPKGDVYAVVSGTNPQQKYYCHIHKNGKVIRELDEVTILRDNMYSEVRSVISTECDSPGYAKPGDYITIFVSLYNSETGTWEVRSEATQRRYGGHDGMGHIAMLRGSLEAGLRIKRGLILDEDNWSLMVNIWGSGQIEAPKVLELTDDYEFLTNWRASIWTVPTVYVDYDVSAGYMITNTNGSIQTTRLYRTSVFNVSCGLFNTYPEYEEERAKLGFLPLGPGSIKTRREVASSITGFDGQIIPMQDGFYFKINYVQDGQSVFPEYYSGYAETNHIPAIMNITIYSPMKKAIFTGKFYAWTNITACRLSSNGFLIGVGKNNIDLPVTLRNHTVEDLVLPGMYELQDGKLKMLISGLLDNQCLRPMKNWKHWWERIKTID